MTAVLTSESASGAVAVRSENRVNGLDVFSLPRVGVDVPFFPDCVREFSLYLRRIASAQCWDPTTAQFMSRDPVVASTRSPYGYSAGSPLNYTDPSGMSPWGSMAGSIATASCGEGGATAFSSDITNVTNNLIIDGGGVIIPGSFDIGGFGGGNITNVVGVGNITDIGNTGTITGGLNTGPLYSEWPPAGATDVGVPGAGWDVKDTNVPGAGIILQPAGAPGNAGGIRIMNPTTDYPGGYIVVYNGVGNGQPLDANLKPGGRDTTHHELPTEELQVP